MSSLESLKKELSETRDRVAELEQAIADYDNYEPGTVLAMGECPFPLLIKLDDGAHADLRFDGDLDPEFEKGHKWVYIWGDFSGTSYATLAHAKRSHNWDPGFKVIFNPGKRA